MDESRAERLKLHPESPKYKEMLNKEALLEDVLAFRLNNPYY